VVFFTIDDGIVRDPAVIDFLRTHRIPVTIFPVPECVDEDAAYFEAIQALGASIQAHSVNHPDFRRLGLAAQRREIWDSLDDFTARFGTRPWLFRPPYGALTPWVPAIARTCRIRAVVMWRATVIDAVLETQGEALHAGDIILMHFRPDLRRDLEVALDAARAAGLRPAPLEQYLTPN
jgi:peptidoglycan/xylan/chitin deacetylase (PgdA/CDA1 family)